MDIMYNPQTWLCVLNRSCTTTCHQLCWSGWLQSVYLQIAAQSAYKFTPQRDGFFLFNYFLLSAARLLVLAKQSQALIIIYSLHYRHIRGAFPLLGRWTTTIIISFWSERNNLAQYYSFLPFNASSSLCRQVNSCFCCRYWSFLHNLSSVCIHNQVEKLWNLQNGNNARVAFLSDQPPSSSSPSCVFISFSTTAQLISVELLHQRRLGNPAQVPSSSE